MTARAVASNRQVLPPAADNRAANVQRLSRSKTRLSPRNERKISPSIVRFRWPERSHSSAIQGQPHMPTTCHPRPPRATPLSWHSTSACKFNRVASALCALTRRNCCVVFQSFKMLRAVVRNDRQSQFQVENHSMITQIALSCAFVSAMLTGSNDAVGSPACCVKNAHCCAVQRDCCPKSANLATGAAAGDVTSREAIARPTCCAKGAYCCLVKRSCCVGSSGRAAVDNSSDIGATPSVVDESFAAVNRYYRGAPRSRDRLYRKLHPEAGFWA